MHALETDLIIGFVCKAAQIVGTVIGSMRAI